MLTIANWDRCHRNLYHTRILRVAIRAEIRTRRWPHANELSSYIAVFSKTFRCQPLTFNSRSYKLSFDMFVLNAVAPPRLHDFRAYWENANLCKNYASAEKWELNEHEILLILRLSCAAHLCSRPTSLLDYYIGAIRAIMTLKWLSWDCRLKRKLNWNGIVNTNFICSGNVHLVILINLFLVSKVVK